MRPVLLELEGFGAFKLPTVVDFDDTDFFALVGPTGSGKSTVIDAICFALYGAIPRYGDERLVAPVMSAGHQETGVRLTFDVGGERYVAARVVRRDRHGKVSTKEARLETAAGRELAGRASEMAAEVERVLGFPFAHFTRCVVLPQGEFARFLHDRPAERQALLIELLDLGVYERMAKEANRRGAEGAADVRAVTERLSALGDVTPEALVAARAAEDALSALGAELAGAAPAVVAADEAAAVADAAVAGARRWLAALGAVQVPEEAGHLAADVAAAQDALERSAAAHVVASADAEAAAVVAAALPEAGSLQPFVLAHRELTGLAAQLAAVVAELDQAGSRSATAGKAANATAAALDRAEQALVRAREAFAAQLLTAGLSTGDPCPVCGQTVHEVPEAPAAVDVQEHQANVRRARTADEEARAAAGEADVALARATERVERVEHRRAELVATVAGHPDAEALAVLVGEVEAAVAAERAARAAERSAAARVAAARADLDAARARTGQLSAGYHAQRDAVSGLGPPPPGDDVVAAWEALAVWAKDQQPGQEAAADAAARAADEARAARAEQLGALAARASVAGVVVAGGQGRDVGLDELRTGAAAAHARAAEAVAALERGLVEVERLTALGAAAAEAATVAQELGRLLSARGFERWLVAEALDRLAEGASVTLQQLSGGQYSLTIGADGEFAVIDHANGDEVRPVRTLSGGETFQASLALALALADELAGLAVGGVAKLDAIFLDEGFGTLDPESLETVAATVESLGSSGRMVGIVTHVRELAARVPVRFEVTKGPATATVERVTG